MKTNWGSLPNSKIGGSGFENSNTKQGSYLAGHGNELYHNHSCNCIFTEKKMSSVHLTGYFKSNLNRLNSIR
jgi:hypothetical protein